MDMVKGAVQIYLCHGRHHQRQFLDNGLARIEPERLLFGQRNLLQTEIAKSVSLFEVNYH